MVRAAITLHKQRNVKKAPKTPKYFPKVLHRYVLTGRNRKRDL